MATAARRTARARRLTSRTGIDLLHILYPGTAPSSTDLIAGQLDPGLTSALAVIAQVRAGRLRALVMQVPQRTGAPPEALTVNENRCLGFEAGQWYGLLAPAGSPPAVLAHRNADIGRAPAPPGVGRQLAAEGAVPMPTTEQAVGALMAREIPRWCNVNRAARVRSGSCSSEQGTALAAGRR